MQTEENITRLSIDIPVNIHKALKHHALQHDTNIKDFVAALIQESLAEEIEDHMLGSLAAKAEKEGSVGKKSSAALLKKLKKITK
ncbi:MAG: hypothetical protein FJX34_02060 [Alphaproteobacteria bacterium]|nr:hypothetical protein [Alphaproteobacteria bacterium]